MSGRTVLVLCACISGALAAAPLFDTDLYERVLDEQLCNEQLTYLSNDTLLLQFLDSSSKLPTGVFSGNLMDLGNYFGCLNINTVKGDLHFEGKYCSITVPFQNNQASSARTAEDEINEIAIQQFTRNRGALDRAMGGSGSISSGLSLSYCIPKVCTFNQTYNFYLGQLQQFVNVTYTENFCRLPNDKPFTPGDYVAITILVVIILLSVASTSYDLYYAFIYQRESDQLLRSFSVYTNTRRFLSFPSNRGALACLDGIRSISMMWVVVGHTFAASALYGIKNVTDVLSWLQSSRSIWITSAPISVDTFFMLAGVLCVYTTLSKVDLNTFIRNLHVFYINRILRMFPLLALMVLLQATLLHHVSDGPHWTAYSSAVNFCREYWWSALIHVQNYVNDREICLGQTWYLSVDMQLYAVTPLVLLCLFGRRAISWGAVAAAVLLSFLSSSLYSYTYNLPGGIVNLRNMSRMRDYVSLYYFNTLARATPFTVGLAFGFLLHTTKNKRINLNKLLVSCLWLLSIGASSMAIIPVYYMAQSTYDNQNFTNFYNAYVRGIWAVALGWLIFACQHGYAGPVNWFLSLPVWRLPARLSYAVYLIHFPLMYVANASAVDTRYFTVGDTFYRFMSDLSLSTVLAFVACIVVDAPCSTLQKLLFEGRKTRTKSKLPVNGAKDVEGENKAVADNGHAPAEVKAA